MKKMIYAAMLLLGMSIMISCDGNGKKWVGTYEQNPWKFELRKDGSATVRSTKDFEYETSWEDGGNWAVVGAFNGEAFLIDKKYNLSIMGSNGQTTGLFKLKKTK